MYLQRDKEILGSYSRKFNVEISILYNLYGFTEIPDRVPVTFLLFFFYRKENISKIHREPAKTPRYPKQRGEETKVESSSYMISKYVLKLKWSEQNGTITKT